MSAASPAPVLSILHYLPPSACPLLFSLLPYSTGDLQCSGRGHTEDNGGELVQLRRDETEKLGGVDRAAAELGDRDTRDAAG